ncbi:N-acetyl-gamma-glutamyl-phosphate reductase [Erythrobacteraceae bacterium WH01K]|nr:N-acetyl-gamma-glutamyl-phosphate reductase [Erythrobacteraceae bacterium WH01K]
MPTRVFIDGAAGTTGLEIHQRLSGREAFELVVLDDAERKDPAARADALAASDIAILCLPDDAAREAVSLLGPDSATRIIDASSAHRTAPGWIYGFPELVGRRTIAKAARVSNPGCYPTGFLALLAPLIRARLLPADGSYSVNAVSGFSGGGNAMIERYEQDRDIAFRTYGLELSHKHLPEMKVHAGLDHAPVFSPAVIPAYRGMLVEIPLSLGPMRGKVTPDDLLAALKDYYQNAPLVRVHDSVPAEMTIRRDQPVEHDGLDLYVAASPEGQQARLIASLDNLGKGASGAAVQSLNLMAGEPETEGLTLPDSAA